MKLKVIDLNADPKLRETLAKATRKEAAKKAKKA